MNLKEVLGLESVSVRLLFHGQELYQNNLRNQTRNVKADISFENTSYIRSIRTLTEVWRLGTEAEKHEWDSSSYLGTPPQHWGFHLEEGMEVQHA